MDARLRVHEQLHQIRNVVQASKYNKEIKWGLGVRELSKAEITVMDVKSS